MTEATASAPAPAAPAPAPAAPAPSPAAPSPAPTAPAPSPAAPAAAPAADSLLAKPGETTAPSPAPAPSTGDEFAWLPEKLRVMGEDGKLDLAATNKKLAESYTNLEKKMGTGERPPENPDAYTFTPPEEFKDVPLDQELSKGFRERMHKLGMSQQQFEGVMGEYYSFLPQVLNAAAQLTATEARTELSKVWTTPTELEAGVNAASRALASAPEGVRDAVWTKFGRDPDFIQFAAAFGKEMKEDTSPSTGGSGGGDDIGKLLAHPAVRDAKHPEHATVSKKIADHFAKQFGTQPAMQ